MSPSSLFWREAGFLEGEGGKDLAQEGSFLRKFILTAFCFWLSRKPCGKGCVQSRQLYFDNAQLVALKKQKCAMGEGAEVLDQKTVQKI